MHLRRFVWRLLGRTYLEDEIVQEAFLALYLHIKSGRAIGTLRPFLYRIVRNMCYDVLRKKKRQPCVNLTEQLVNQRLSYQFGDHHLPEEALLANEVYREVQDAMQKLPELQRQTLILFYQEEFSYVEIAEVMGVDVGTIKSRLHYAKQGLRNLIRK